MRNLLKIAFLVTVCLALQKCKEPQQAPKQEVPQQEVLTPESSMKRTFASTDVPYQMLAVENEIGQTLKLVNGTEIQIPANVFVDILGNPIQGRVDLSYREFHNAAEIIASGIPMTYKENGKNYAFESGGMFEIRGTQAGKPVFIKEGGQIKVNLASFTKEQNFNHYFLAKNKVRTAYLNPFFTSAYAQSNTQSPTSEWFELGKTQTIPNYRKQNELDSLESIYLAEADQLSQLQTKVLATPSQWLDERKKQAQAIAHLDKRERLNYFHLNFNLKENPTLAMYAGVHWHYEGIDVKNENPNLNRNQWVLQENWESIDFSNPLFLPKKELKAKKGASFIKKVVFSLDSKHFLVLNETGADLWTANGEFVHHFKQMSDAVFAPDNQHILGAVRNEAKIFTFKGKVLHHFKGHASNVKTVEFSTQGDYVLTFSSDETAKLWDNIGNHVLTVKDSRKSWLVGAKFYNPEGTEVLVQAHDGEIMRYDAHGNFIEKSTDYERNTTYTPYLPKPAYRFNNVSLITQNKPAEWTKKEEILCAGVPIRLPAVSVYEGNSKSAIDQLVLNGRQLLNTFLSPDNQYIVTAIKDEGNVVIWTKNMDKNIMRIKLSKTETDFTPSRRGNTYTYTFSTLVSQKEEASPTTQSPDSQKKPSLAVLNARYQAARKAYLEAKLAKDKERLKNEADLLRMFSVNKFGVYNCDRIYNDPNVVAFNANFYFGEKYHFTVAPKLFLITGKRGTAIIENYVRSNSSFYFNPKEDNRMIVILPDDKVAVFQREDFKNIDIEKLKADRSYTFEMKVQNASIKSMDDLRQIFTRN